jgi:cell division septal protein FtsQ
MIRRTYRYERKKSFRFYSLKKIFLAVLLIGLLFWSYYIFFVIGILNINEIILDLPESLTFKEELLKKEYLTKTKNNILLALLTQNDQSIFTIDGAFSGGKIEIDILKKNVYLKPILRNENSIWCDFEHTLCVSIDEDGFVIRNVNYTQSAALLTIESPKELLPLIKQNLKQSNIYFFIKEFNNLLLKNNFLPIKNEIINQTDFNVYLNNGFFLKVSSDIKAPEAFNFFMRLYENLDNKEKSNLEYIDLRIGNKVFYKLKSTTP